MRVSSRADYGVRALFDLAERYGNGPTQSRDIAARQRVPEAYLHQVMGLLNRGGLVRSTRGPLGGHELVRDPGEITLWDALIILDGPDTRAHPHPDGAMPGDVVHDVWHELQVQAMTFLQKLTLLQLVERSRLVETTANYSI